MGPGVAGHAQHGVHARRAAGRRPPARARPGSGPGRPASSTAGPRRPAAAPPATPAGSRAGSGARPPAPRRSPRPARPPRWSASAPSKGQRCSRPGSAAAGARAPRGTGSGQAAGARNTHGAGTTSQPPSAQDRYITLDEGLANGSVKIVEIGAQNENVGNAPVQAPQQRQVANQRRSANARSNDDLFGSGEVTGNVNKLLVENKSGKPLFLMPGEVISGGKQDRTIGQETVIDSSDKPVPIDVFCVENGRWAGRSTDDIASQLGSGGFNASQSVVVSQSASVDQLAKEAKGGKFIASVGQLNKDARIAVQQTGDQQKVWEEVGKANSKVGNKSSSSDFAENYFSRDTAKDLEPFLAKLKSVGDAKQIVGVAVAVNGKMLSVDVFESTPLFKKFWPKLLKSYALDAIATPGTKKKTSSISVDDCIAFLKNVEKAKPQITKLANAELEKHDSSKGISFSYHDPKSTSASASGGAFGGSVHTTVLSK